MPGTWCSLGQLQPGRSNATAHSEKTRRERHVRFSTFQRERLTPSDVGSSVRHCSERSVAVNCDHADLICQPGPHSDVPDSDVGALGIRSPIADTLKCSFPAHN